MTWTVEDLCPENPAVLFKVENVTNTMHSYSIFLNRLLGEKERNKINNNNNDNK